MSNNVLVIGAHPDDEILGCGGTTALHANNGDNVMNVIVCEGESIRYKNEDINQRKSAFEAAEALGVQNVEFLNFPDQKLDTFTLTDIITPLERIINEFKPNIIYTQYGGDINRDHELLFKAVLVATRPMEKFIKNIYAFDTASSTEWGFPRNFEPDTWVDISSTLNKKLEAMKCYESEIREYPHPRSLKSLKYRAKAWGNQSLMDAAEVFMTIRKVSRNGETPA
jgi:LmbE family N-acetylglucosaminyl deacetylase